MTWESLSDAVRRLEEGTPPPAWAGLFGASPRPEESSVVLVPVTWDATVSYSAGTAAGPEAIVRASHQLDLEDAAFDQPYKCGITMLPEDKELADLNAKARAAAVEVIEGQVSGDLLEERLAFVNGASRTVNERVRDVARRHLAADKIVGIVGGDHSSPYGLLQALAEKHGQGFGILHFDAHFDLRKAYEGFEHSHASIMYNAMETLPAAQCLVQVGIRDYSGEERRYQERLRGASKAFYARDLFRRKARGETWHQTTTAIIEDLPQDVYVSFDVDGLDPTYCPSTGTPVPGGLSYDEAMYVLEELVRTGRRIIGFDLCEVAPGADGDEWDANVGARILYKLCGAALASRKLCRTL